LATGRGAAFTCHASLHAFTVPVTDEQGVQMVLLGGKAFSTYEDFFAFRETAQRYGVDATKLLSLVKDIQFKEPPFLESAAALVDTIARSLIRSLTSGAPRGLSGAAHDAVFHRRGAPQPARPGLALPPGAEHRGRAVQRQHRPDPGGRRER
jgi:hypothetical protein